jgi:hypothetical protein
MPRRILTILTLLAAVGCGGSGMEKKVPITLDQVPENVMKVAKEKLPDVKFERAMKKPNGEFEVIGKNKNGKIREIDIKPDGTVTEIE